MDMFLCYNYIILKTFPYQTNPNNYMMRFVLKWSTAKSNGQSSLHLLSWQIGWYVPCSDMLMYLLFLVKFPFVGHQNFIWVSPKLGVHPKIDSNSLCLDDYETPICWWFSWIYVPVLFYVFSVYLPLIEMSDLNPISLALNKFHGCSSYPLIN